MNAPFVFLRKRILPFAIILAVSLGVATLALFAQTPDAASADGPGTDPLIVNWQALEPQAGYTVTRSFVGRVEARQESRVGFEVPGLLNALNAQEGDRVTAGQTLATLSTALLEAQRDELTAARDQAQAQLELSDLRLHRVTRAHAQRAATDDELDEAQQTQRAAAADLARTEAALRSLEVEIGKRRLVAPFDAVVNARHVDIGQVVAAGSPIVELYETRRPEVRLGVGGSALDQLAEGQAHDVHIGELKVSGTIRRVLPSRGRVGRDVDVILELDAELDGIRRGDLARVELTQARDTPGVWLPVQALTEGVRGLWAVYLIQENEAAGPVLRRADVEIIHPQTDRVYVRGDLPADAKIVTDGLHRLAPGMAVRLADPPRDPQAEAPLP